MTDPTVNVPLPHPADEPSPPTSASTIKDMLDKVTAEYHKLRGDAVPDRAEQWDGHVATLGMVADHTQEALDNAAQEAKNG